MSYTLSEMTTEIRKEFPDFAGENDDHTCMAKFANSVVAFECKLDSVKLPANISNCPKTEAFIRKAIEKRQEGLSNWETLSNDKFTAFKKKMTELLRKDAVLKECVSVSTTEFNFGSSIVQDFRDITTGISDYYLMNSTKAGVASMNNMSKTLVVCLDKLFKGEEITANLFNDDTKTFAGPLVKISDIFSRVNPELKSTLISEFKDMLRAILRGVILLRFPVSVSPTAKPIYFGRWVGPLVLGEYLTLLGVSLQEMTIYVN